MKKLSGRPKEVILMKTAKMPAGIVKTIRETLFRFGIIEVPSLGVFSITNVRARRHFNNFAKKTIVLPAHKRIHFEPCEDMKTICKK